MRKRFYYHDFIVENLLEIVDSKGNYEGNM